VSTGADLMRKLCPPGCLIGLSKAVDQDLLRRAVSVEVVADAYERAMSEEIGRAVYRRGGVERYSDAVSDTFRLSWRGVVLSPGQLQKILEEAYLEGAAGR
jgi:hypothetical protein